MANLIDDHLLENHMYADDTKLIEYTTASNIPNAIMKLQNCVESIHEWCRSRRLPLNPAKTELIWFGSKASLKKTVHLYLNLYIGADVIKPVGVVRDLWVFLDAELNMDQHVKTVVRSCFYHLRRLKSVRRILGREVTLCLVSQLMQDSLTYPISSSAKLTSIAVIPARHTHWTSLVKLSLPEPSSLISSGVVYWVPEYLNTNNWGMQIDWWMQPRAVFGHIFSGTIWHIPHK